MVPANIGAPSVAHFLRFVFLSSHQVLYVYIWLEICQEQAKSDERKKKKQKKEKENARVVPFKILGKGGRNPSSYN